ncbi:MAG TPA: hypothetical protein VFC21_05665 [Bryobacteraceae bacterium]|nr:hypothetical protein [Bryobacteraceae bacterium]
MSRTSALVDSVERSERTSFSILPLSSKRFRWILTYLEAWNRGWSRAPKKVVMGDGAEWIWNLADLHFPGAVQIVDLFHLKKAGRGKPRPFAHGANAPHIVS